MSDVSWYLLEAIAKQGETWVLETQPPPQHSGFAEGPRPGLQDAAPEGNAQGNMSFSWQYSSKWTGFGLLTVEKDPAIPMPKFQAM